jgi:hypothetical protein
MNRIARIARALPPSKSHGCATAPMARIARVVLVITTLGTLIYTVGAPHLSGG